MGLSLLSVIPEYTGNLFIASQAGGRGLILWLEGLCSFNQAQLSSACGALIWRSG